LYRLSSHPRTPAGKPQPAAQRSSPSGPWRSSRGDSSRQAGAIQVETPRRGSTKRESTNHAPRNTANISTSDTAPSPHTRNLQAHGLPARSLRCSPWSSHPRRTC
jgi:hypothetical protein